MRWLFLIPLATPAVTIYVSQRSDDEITYLTTTVTVISLILSLILAPWELQVFVLILAFLIVRQLWNQLENRNDSENTQQEQQDSKEVKNQSGSFLVTKTASETEEKITRTYRGIPWEKKSSPTVAEGKPKKELKYRGNKVSS